MARLRPLKNWVTVETRPDNYEVGFDPDLRFGSFPTACVRSETTDSEAACLLMQSCDATCFQGKRVRLSAFVRAQEVALIAFLWIQFDHGSARRACRRRAFRLANGECDWRTNSVQLDVAADATVLEFGVTLAGRGSIWLADVHVDVVGESDRPEAARVPKPLAEVPANLRFAD